MKIAIVAPVEEPIPPRAYGGIERVVHLLDRGLAARGHDVLLLASGDSSSAGRLRPLTPRPVGRGSDGVAKSAAAQAAVPILGHERPDIVLSHAWRLLDHATALPCPVLTTVHYPLDAGPHRTIFLSRPWGRYVSISLSQQRTAPSLQFAGNVYNGIDVETMPFCPSPGAYLAFLGRASPDKGLDIAIRVARAAAIPLKVAVKIDVSQRRWFETVVRPLCRPGGVEFVGELSTADRGPFLAGSLALLHPSRWSEPFGLAAVEAMACGAPVLALRRGAAMEVVLHGRTGFVVDDEEGLVDAVGHVGELDRAAARAHVRARFTHARMVNDYEALAGAAQRA